MTGATELTNCNNILVSVMVPISTLRKVCRLHEDSRYHGIPTLASIGIAVSYSRSEYGKLIITEVARRSGPERLNISTRYKHLSKSEKLFDLARRS